MSNASPQPRRSNQRRRSRSNRSNAIDIWRRPGPMPDLQPIEAANDPAALIRSLGAPPQLGGRDASYYFESVVERSTAVARALALSVSLLSEDSTNDA